MEPLTLVLLPGLDGTGLLFQPLLAALPAGMATVVVRYPVDRVMGYDDLVTEVIGRMPDAGRVVLVGESFGGPLAMLVAARRPPGMVGLVLCATFVTSPRPWVGPLMRPLARPAVFRLYPAYKRVVRGSWAAAAEVSRLVRPDVIASRVRMVLSVDARAALAACPVPVLYLRASGDHVVPAGNLRRLRRVRRDVAVVTIRSGHQLLQRRPAESAAAILSFADGLIGR